MRLCKVCGLPIPIDSKNYKYCSVKCKNAALEEWAKAGNYKKYYGRYYIQEKRIVVFINDVNGNQLPYHEILDTVLHEAIHHYQHHYEEGFVRLKGVMHNLDFKRMYEEKMSKLREWEVIPCA